MRRIPAVTRKPDLFLEREEVVESDPATKSRRNDAPDRPAPRVRKAPSI
jgi:hypothetical protein